jgi:hypothetical protein
MKTSEHDGSVAKQLTYILDWGHWLILIQVIHDFPQSFKANARIAP